jgi:hypothetical protein
MLKNINKIVGLVFCFLTLGFANIIVSLEQKNTTVFYSTYYDFLVEVEREEKIYRAIYSDLDQAEREQKIYSAFYNLQDITLSQPTHSRISKTLIIGREILDNIENFSDSHLQIQLFLDGALFFMKTLIEFLKKMNDNLYFSEFKIEYEKKICSMEKNLKKNNISLQNESFANAYHLCYNIYRSLESIDNQLNKMFYNSDLKEAHFKKIMEPSIIPQPKKKLCLIF